MADHDSATLRRENEDLKETVNRLNRELYRCQMTMGVELPKAVQLPGEELLPPWASNASLLSPLLLAYDNRIGELENALERSRTSLEEQTEKIKRLTLENNQLREEMERKWKAFAEKQKQDLDGGGIGISFYNEEKNEMQERIELLTRENNMMLEQLQIFKSRNEQLERYSRECEEIANKSTAGLKAFENDFLSIQHTAGQLQTDKQVVEEKLKKTYERLALIEREREEAITGVTRLSNDLKLAQQQVQHYRSAFEDLEKKRSGEVESLVMQVQTLTLQDREASSRDAAREKETDELRFQCEDLKRELESSRTECSHMLKSLEDCEQQLLSLKNKEDNVNRLFKESNERVREAELDRDRAILNEQQALRKVSHLEETGKKQEMMQKNNYEAILDAVKKKHRAAIDARDRELHEMQEQSGTLQLQVEKLARDVQTHSGDAERATNLLDEERTRMAKRTSANEAKCREVEERCIKEKQYLIAEVYQLKTEKENWERTQQNLDSANAALSREATGQRGLAQQLQEESRRVKAQAEDLLKERDSLVGQLNTLRESYYEKLAEAAGQYNRKISELEEQVAEARLQQKEREAKAFDLLKLQETHTQKWKEEHHQTVIYFERVVSELNEEIKRLQARNKELGDPFPVRERLAAR